MKPLKCYRVVHLYTKQEWPLEYAVSPSAAIADVQERVCVVGHGYRGPWRAVEYDPTAPVVEPTVYTVVVSDGYTPTGPSVRKSCGHNHKTRERAEECLAHLRHVRYVHGQREESAAWYNAQVLPHHRGSWARVEES